MFINSDLLNSATLDNCKNKLYKRKLTLIYDLSIRTFTIYISQLGSPLKKDC